MTEAWSGVGRPPVMVIDGKKVCSRCKKNKPTYEFSRDYHAASGYRSACKDCSANPVGNVARTGMTAEQLKVDSVLWSKYRIRLSDFDRMYEEQDGRCAICNTDPTGTHYEKLCVDHDHATGKVRGLLCRECNFGLGKFADDPDRLLSAAAYLMREE